MSTYVMVRLSFSMVSSSSPSLYTKISTSFVYFYFSFPFFFFLILFSLRDHKLKLCVECSLKSSILFASQLEDGLFLGLFHGVKNFFIMIPLLVYYKCSFHDLFSFSNITTIGRPLQCNTFSN